MIQARNLFESWTYLTFSTDALKNGSRLLEGTAPNVPLVNHCLTNYVQLSE